MSIIMDIIERKRRAATAPEPATSGRLAIAEQIIAAGRKRRNEMPAELPDDPVAAQIILAGMKCRGEIA